jgi:type IV secretory pathway VirB10-like protein
MKRIFPVMTCLVFVAMATMAFSQSLADLAKKEKERRQAVKTDTKVITNDQTARYNGAAVTTGTPPPPPPDKTGAVKQPGAGEAAAGADQAKPAADEPVDFTGRPESFWKQTFADARKLVKDLDVESNVLALKLTDLQNRFYKESDGFKQQTIQRDIQKTIYEIDMNRENVEKAKKSLADLETEARKSGALPGWIR